MCIFTGRSLQYSEKAEKELQESLDSCCSWISGVLNRVILVIVMSKKSIKSFQRFVWNIPYLIWNDLHFLLKYLFPNNNTDDHYWAWSNAILFANKSSTLVIIFAAFFQKEHPHLRNFQTQERLNHNLHIFIIIHLSNKPSKAVPTYLSTFSYSSQSTPIQI